jgi:alginate O-acetyltransferase complex protein AlgI
VLFNSFEFILFFIVVYSIYLKLGRKMQNRLLLIASYFFYGAWDWRFLSLIWISTIVDYLVGKRLENTVDVKIKKRLVAISVTANLALLATFKYFNFFADSFVDLFNSMGLQLSPGSVKIILPVGISFYTFQTISYSIDIYRGKLKAVKNIFPETSTCLLPTKPIRTLRSSSETM